MVSFFGGKEKSGGNAVSAERVPRNSSGWGKILERMRGEESLRVLDVGPTSSGNINFITALGHSIYLANLVEDATRKEWTAPQPDGTPGPFDVERFLTTHLNFSGRGFDIVLLWDTPDYLPEPIVAPVLQRF
ncbi:MAG TPA: SAM-dependent methyltransferase, partial [Acidobacteriaceae bacterium]|nr:SAM-dependent methyltransferase [Acidobacteriaceae bacterium]